MNMSLLFIFDTKKSLKIVFLLKNISLGISSILHIVPEMIKPCISKKWTVQESIKTFIAVIVCKSTGDVIYKVR